MSEARFTKGPWGIARALKMHEVCHITSAVRIYSECEPDKDASYDAELIACAPEMYAMLESIIAAYEMDWDDTEKVINLLAKARGEK